MSSAQIYNIARDSVVILNQASNTFTGWIHQVQNKRIYVLCCAHSILSGNGTTFPVTPLIATILGNVTNAVKSGKQDKNNITVTFGILGMNVSADIAVLFSYTEDEADNENGIFGFNFSSKTKILKFGDENLVSPGTKLYCVNDSFGSPDVGLSIGYINQTAVIFSPGPNYTNNTGTIISNLTIAPGSSGSPIMVLMDNKIRVIGMVNWQNSSNPGFIGGASQSLLEDSYNKIAKLNNVFFNDSKDNDNCLNDEFINFTGLTGKGFLGVGSFTPVQDSTLTYLNETYPAFAASKYANLSDGVLIKSFSSFPVIPPNTGITNAFNCDGETVQIDDIIVAINGVKVGYANRNIIIQSAIYFNAGGKVELKILRPSTAQKLKFTVTVSQYPPELEYVSTDPSITLLSDEYVLGSPTFNLFQIASDGSVAKVSVINRTETLTAKIQSPMIPTSAEFTLTISSTQQPLKDFQWNEPLNFISIQNSIPHYMISGNTNDVVKFDVSQNQKIVLVKASDVTDTGVIDFTVPFFIKNGKGQYIADYNNTTDYNYIWLNTILQPPFTFKFVSV